MSWLVSQFYFSGFLICESYIDWESMFLILLCCTHQIIVPNLSIIFLMVISLTALHELCWSPALPVIL